MQIKIAHFSHLAPATAKARKETNTAEENNINGFTCVPVHSGASLLSSVFSVEALSLRTKLNMNRKIDRTENKGHVQPNASELFLAPSLSPARSRSRLGWLATKSRRKGNRLCPTHESGMKLYALLVSHFTCSRNSISGSSADRRKEWASARDND